MIKLKQNLAEINSKFSELSIVDKLKYAEELFGNELCFSTSLGAEDQLITHFIAVNSLDIGIFTLDTGRLFPETYDLIDSSCNKYNIKIKIAFPDTKEVEEMVNDKGINLFYNSIENRKLCCNIRKTRPLNKILSNKSAWITGLRKEQSVTRKDLQFIEWDEVNGLYKINPLLNWTEKEVWNKIDELKVPVNSLHKKNFPSIGCQPCTRAIMEGEDVRAGRWWWENPETKECGLHKM